MVNYKHLNKKERENIYDMLQKWYTQNEIAKELNRDKWTISRELKRNKTIIDSRINNNVQEKNKKENRYYLPDKANKKYKNRKKKAWKKRSILKWWEVFFSVIELLRKWYSPEIISWRLKIKKWIRISHEAIYQFIYNKDYRNLKLWEYLPMRRIKRKTNTWRKMNRNNIPNRVDISERPLEIETRNNVWHWEWDSIEWKRWTWSCLHVSVERCSRLTKIRKISRKQARLTNLAILNIFSNIPAVLRKTITFDNWSEFTSWERLKENIWIDCYFTHPYSSWEKWTVERMNWFIRRFFPKWTDFNKVTDQEIQLVEDWINNRPMACLNFSTPNEIFSQSLISL